MRKGLLTFVTVLMMLVCIGAGRAVANVGYPVNIEIRTASDFYAADVQSIDASIAVSFDVPVSKVRIHVTGNGVVRANLPELIVEGPWEPGNAYEFSETFSISGAGTGHLQITAEVLRANGTTEYSTKRRLYVVADSRDTWISNAGLIDARIKRSRALEAGESDGRAGAQGKGGQSHETLNDIITVPSNTTTNPPAPIKPGKLENLINQQFGAQPAVTVSAPTGAAPRSISVSGTVQWTDQNGVAHPLPLAEIIVYDTAEPSLVDVEIVRTTTGASGRYSASFTTDDGPDEGGADIVIHVLARSVIAQVTPLNAEESVYRMTSDTFFDTADGADLSINLTASNANETGAAFSIHHALVVIGTYASGLTDSTPPAIGVRYPAEGSFYRFNSGEIAMDLFDRWDWDIAHHEYGHYFGELYALDASAGGPHFFGQHNSLATNKEDGTALAWSEGLASFFAVAGQQVTGALALGIPNVGDLRFENTENAPYAFNLENDFRSVGEDDEGSVAIALWDLFDDIQDGQDTVQISDRKLFQTFIAAQPVRLSDAWEAVVADLPTAQRAQVAGVFTQAAVAPELTAPANNASINPSAAPPTFAWKKNGAGAAYGLDDFTIKFYNSDYSSVLLQRDVGDTDTFTPTTDELATILTGDTFVHWVVEGSSSLAPATPNGTLAKYWSGSRTLGGVTVSFVIDDTTSMTDEIDNIRVALTAHINAIKARVTDPAQWPTVQLITFKDTVTTRILSKDLDAVLVAINALSTDGGGEQCAEAGAQAIRAALDSMSPGGAIVLATDAASLPGVDVGRLITDLNAAKVSVNTLLSGDCGGDIASRPSDLTALDQIAANIAIQPTSLSVPSSFLAANSATSIDEFGDSVEDATPLLIDRPALRGLVDASADPDDYLRIDLLAGVTYAVQVQVENGDPVALSLLDRDASTAILTGSTTDNTIAQFSYTPTESGVYYLRISNTASTIASVYLVQTLADPFASLDSGVALYSTLSNITGGVFAVVDTITVADDEQYQAVTANLLQSTFGPAVVGTHPNTLPRGSSLAVTLKGRNTNWNDSSTIAFAQAGVTAQVQSVASATQLTAIVTLAPTATLGLTDLTVSTPVGNTTETATGRQSFKVIESSQDATIVSVDTQDLQQGTTSQITIRGLNTRWDATSAVSFGAGLTVSEVQIVSPTQIQVTVTVADDATIGYRTVQVGAQAQARSIFVYGRISTVPTITSITPSRGKQGEVTTVEIRARDTAFSQATTIVSFGDGVQPFWTVTSPTTIEVEAQVEPDAELGARDVVIFSESGSVSRLGGFVVEKNDEPRLIEVSPAQVSQASRDTVVITGRNTAFDAGSTSVDFGPGITVVSTNVISPTVIEVAIEVDQAAPLSERQVVVTTGNETAILNGGFFVGPNLTAPFISRVAPGSAQPGQVLDVEIEAVDTRFEDGVTVVSFGDGINATPVVDSPTSITVRVEIDDDATLGSRDVVVTTGSEEVVLSDGFLVGVVDDRRIKEVTPFLVYQNTQPSITVRAENTAFDDSTTIEFGEGVQVLSVDVLSSTALVAQVDIKADAIIGYRDVVVSTAGNRVSDRDGIFVDVNDGEPQIISNAPDDGFQGETLTVTVDAINASFEDGSTIAELGSGITTLSTTVLSSNRLEMAVRVEQDAEEGFRTLVVTTGPEVLESTFAFYVNQNDGEPVLTSATPSRVKQGEQVTVKLSALNTSFEQGATIVEFGIGITVLSTNVISATELEARIQIDDFAQVGTRIVDAVTGSEIAFLFGEFFVEEGTGARLTSISPASAVQGESLTVTVNGVNTGFDAALTTVQFGDGVTVESTNVTSATGLTVQISVDDDAEFGYRDVVVTTGAQVVSLPVIFLISEDAGDPPGDLTISIDADPFTEVGQYLSIRYRVTNEGLTPVDEIAVTHSLGDEPVCTIDELSPSFEVICTAVYLTTAADVAAGRIDVTARVGNASATQTIPLGGRQGDLSITITADDFTQSGQLLTLKYTIENTSSTDAIDITVEHTLADGPACVIPSLAPTFAAVCTFVYRTTDEDVQAGEIRVTVSADGVSKTSVVPYQRNDASSDVRIDIQHDPLIAPAQSVHLKYTVSNNGETELTDLVASDNLEGTPDCDIGSLSAGYAAVCQLNYLLTADDVDAGFINVTVIAGETTKELVIPLPSI